MRNVPFSTILNESIQLCGLDRTTLDLKTFGVIRDMCGNRLTMIWDREQWPEAVRWAENRFAGYTIISVSCAAGIVTVTLDNDEIDYIKFPDTGDSMAINFIDGIWTSGNITINLSGTYDITVTGTYQFTFDTGDASLTGSSNVTEFPYKGATYFADAPEYIIRLPDTSDTVLGVWNADPRQNTRPRVVGFTLEERGVISSSDNVGYINASWIRVSEPGPLWVQYKELPVTLYGDPYVATYTYSVGEQVYSGSLVPTLITSSGFDFYVADEPTAGDFPPTSNTGQWRPSFIPYRFKDYLIRGIVADYLRAEGQFAQAELASAEAEKSLQLALDALLRQSQQIQRVNMINTY